MWPDSVDEILGGDQAVALAHVTPAQGVVLTPVTNFALRNREARTVAVNSSVGMWKKLARIRRNPHVAVAFHTRDHALNDRPEYLLVQGRATLSSMEDPDAWLDAMGEENWERIGGKPRDVGPLWNWWLRAYHWRVNIQIDVERLVVWPDLACRGAPEVHGAPLPPEPPAAQRPPARGTGPRIDHIRAASTATKLPHVLLAWVGRDGLPVVVPVEVTGTEERGLVLESPGGLVPGGGRRAGLLAHWFSRHAVGQRQRKHTGWLEADVHPGRAVYAPHTETGYRLPPWRFAFNVGAGFVTRRGVREAQRAGFIGPWA
jgi:nitroimidazol reductase NimA-like FMN-containing flavoprotein (pyridoxamine 5'-phosphate oxidase superfamily)